MDLREGEGGRERGREIMDGEGRSEGKRKVREWKSEGR